MYKLDHNKGQNDRLIAFKWFFSVSNTRRIHFQVLLLFKVTLKSTGLTLSLLHHLFHFQTIRVGRSIKSSFSSHNHHHHMFNVQNVVAAARSRAPTIAVHEVFVGPTHNDIMVLLSPIYDNLYLRCQHYPLAHLHCYF